MDLFPLAETYNENIVKNKLGRWKSWDLCFKEFQAVFGGSDYGKNFEDIPEDVIQLLNLELAFYLASWGMYRGSSFLLQMDKEVHLPAIEVLWSYRELGSISPEDVVGDSMVKIYASADGQIKEQEMKRCEAIVDLANNLKAVYAKAYEEYYEDLYSDCHKGEETNKKININISDTLVTKVMLGTLACSPAFDTFFMKGVTYVAGKECKEKKFGYSMNSAKRLESIQSITEWMHNKKHDEFLKLKKSISGKSDYPDMKVVDFFFWDAGYFLSLIDSIEGELKKGASKANRTKINKNLWEIKKHISVEENKDLYNDVFSLCRFPFDLKDNQVDLSEVEEFVNILKESSASLP